LGIDNLIVEINNKEPTILDGSAKIFAETLLKGGLKEFDAFREYSKSLYILKLEKPEYTHIRLTSLK
jgi:UDP-3-O-[3-hydroxymyristoyl] N-acetylglucosamine deacetylase/3-hydroxyacyl-[acyl-carrier-protein] dehydratase